MSKPRNRHVTPESRSNGPRVIETATRSPMLPMYSASELSVRAPRRLSCVYEAACVNVIAKTYPTAIAAECPDGCSSQRQPDPHARVYDASMSGQGNAVEAKRERTHSYSDARRSYAHRLHSRS
jgi:hypothetical protein